MAFTLNPKPTFKHIVHIPVPGSKNPDDGKLTVTYNHMTGDKAREKHKEMIDGVTEAVKTGGDIYAPQIAYLQEIMAAWALKDELNEENLRLMVLNYPQAFDTIASGYLSCMLAGRYEEDRQKN